MLPFLRKKTNDQLGLDISSSSIKMLELSRQGDRFHVESYAVEPLPAQAVSDANISDVEAVGEALARLIARAKPSVRRAAVAMPESLVWTRTVEMEGSLSEDEMESQIRVEADQLVPFPLDEVALDFAVLGPSESKPNQVVVQLAASRNENIELRKDALEIGGVTARTIDLESYAMERAFDLMIDSIDARGKVVGIVDIGAVTTNFHVIAQDRTLYQRSQLFGGKQLTEEIQRRYGLTMEEAGMVKKHGGLPDNYELEVLLPFKEAAAQQVQRCLQLFFSSTTHADVDHLVLAGGSASIAGLAQLVQDKLGRPVSVANPFVNMSISSRVNAAALSMDAPALMIACGLALRSFD